jgi:hypothetical protein
VGGGREREGEREEKGQGGEEEREREIGSRSKFKRGLKIYIKVGLYCCE